MVHGDLMFRHVFAAEQQLAGIIDWGDASLTDRHYESAQIQLNLFDGDKSMVRAPLDHSNRPVERGFACLAVGQAFHRQAIVLVRHRRMDVFYTLPNLLSLEETGTLDELSDIRFGL